jgi:sulfonate transport system permease protein
VSAAVVKAGSGLALGAVVPLALLALWEVAARAGWLNAYLLPAPGAVLAAGIGLARSGELARNLWASGARVLIGFAVAVVTAVPLGVALAEWRPLERLLHFPLEFLRATPPLALLPLLVLWFGIGEAPKWAVIVLASFFPVLLNTVAGLRSVRPQLLELARTLDLTPLERVWFVIVPSALPTFVAGLRLAFGYSWRALVGAELIATSVGLGYMVMDAQAIARSDVVYAGILVIGTVGFLADRGFMVLARRLAGEGVLDAQD